MTGYPTAPDWPVIVIDGTTSLQRADISKLIAVADASGVIVFGDPVERVMPPPFTEVEAMAKQMPVLSDFGGRRNRARGQKARDREERWRLKRLAEMERKRARGKR